MENAGLAAAHDVEEIARALPVEMLPHALGGAAAQGLHREVLVRIRIVDRGAVHHDQRHVEHGLAHLQGEEGGRVLAHQADLRAVLVEVVRDGIVKKGVENTIANVSRLARFGMQETDREIIRLMIES